MKRIFLKIFALAAGGVSDGVDLLYPVLAYFYFNLSFEYWTGYIKSALLYPVLGDEQTEGQVRIKLDENTLCPQEQRVYPP